MEESVDFVDQIAEHLGMNHNDALAVLGGWLVSYEPVKPTRMRIGGELIALARGARRKSLTRG